MEVEYAFSYFSRFHCWQINGNLQMQDFYFKVQTFICITFIFLK